MKTYAKGKDAALEDTISKINLLLKKQNVVIEEVAWLNPLPDVWSVIVRDKNRHFLFSNGKGISRKAALASALGEFVERLATNFFFSEYYLGNKEVYQPNEKFFPLSSKDFLSEKLWNFYNPDNELKPENLVDINSGNPERGIRCLPFKSLSSNETIFFPANLLDNLYVSNGMAAGNSASEAQSQALSEIIERYVKFKIISEEISLPEIPEKIIEQFPKIIAAQKKLKAHGFEMLVKDASLGGEFPVVNVTLINSKNGTCLAAFGAHPKFEVALERTLIELLQGRSLELIGEFKSPVFDSGTVSDYTNLEEHFIDSDGVISWKYFNENTDYKFQEWDFDGTTKEETGFLKKIIDRLNFEIFINKIDFYGFHVCRIIVPGMSEIYPVDDLIWNNKNEGLFFHNEILDFMNMSLKQLNSLLDKIENANLNNNQLVFEFIGVPPLKKSDWNDLTIAELKIILALKIKNPQRALDYFYEGFSPEQFTGEKKMKYRCLKTMLEIEAMPEYKIYDYEDNLSKLFGNDNFELCRKLMYGNPNPGG